MWKSIGGLLLVAAAVSAQEGFPLDGTWRGERQADGQAPVTIVVVMQWDGQKVTGVINPGPQAIPISSAELIPAGWRVTLAARTAAGEPVGFDGVIEDLGSYNRAIRGTWTERGRSYQVRMVRE
jgi:hypothetical protein